MSTLPDIHYVSNWIRLLRGTDPTLKKETSGFIFFCHNNLSGNISITKIEGLYNLVVAHSKYSKEFKLLNNEQMVQYLFDFFQDISIIDLSISNILIPVSHSQIKVECINTITHGANEFYSSGLTLPFVVHRYTSGRLAVSSPYKGESAHIPAYLLHWIALQSVYGHFYFEETEYGYVLTKMIPSCKFIRLRGLSCLFPSTAPYSDKITITDSVLLKDPGWFQGEENKHHLASYEAHKNIYSYPCCAPTLFTITSMGKAMCGYIMFNGEKVNSKLPLLFFSSAVKVLDQFWVIYSEQHKKIIKILKEEVEWG
jgi:hypothetical protein